MERFLFDKYGRKHLFVDIVYTSNKLPHKFQRHVKCSVKYEMSFIFGHFHRSSIKTQSVLTIVLWVLIMTINIYTTSCQNIRFAYSVFRVTSSLTRGNQIGIHF